jgi:hypothetical protein
MLARCVVLIPYSASAHPEIPILELTPPHPAKNNSPHFTCLREPILQPLSFQIHAGMGGVPPSSLSMLDPQLWWVEDSYPVGTPDPCSKSHGIISFADPYPLTPFESHRLQNRAGGLETSPHPVVPLTHLESALTRSLPFHTRLSHSKLLRINTFKSVHSEQLKVPLESTLLKKRGGGYRLSLTRSVNQKSNNGLLSRSTTTFAAPTQRGHRQSADLSSIAQTTPLCLIYIVAVLSSPLCVRGIALSSRLGGHHE